MYKKGGVQMKEIKFLVNFGGYLGAEDEYYVTVDDNATEAEIENEIENEFLEIIRDNCYWEIIEEEDE